MEVVEPATLKKRSMWSEWDVWADDVGGGTATADEQTRDPGELVAEEGARSLEMRSCGFDSIESLPFGLD